MKKIVIRYKKPADRAWQYVKVSADEAQRFMEGLKAEGFVIESA